MAGMAVGHSEQKMIWNVFSTFKVSINVSSACQCNATSPSFPRMSRIVEIEIPRQAFRDVSDVDLEPAEKMPKRVSTSSWTISLTSEL
jgi:hypothetical protein